MLEVTSCRGLGKRVACGGGSGVGLVGYVGNLVFNVIMNASMFLFWVCF